MSLAPFLFLPQERRWRLQLQRLVASFYPQGASVAELTAAFLEAAELERLAQAEVALEMLAHVPPGLVDHAAPTMMEALQDAWAAQLEATLASLAEDWSEILGALEKDDLVLAFAPQTFSIPTGFLATAVSEAWPSRTVGSSVLLHLPSSFAERVAEDNGWTLLPMPLGAPVDAVVSTFVDLCRDGEVGGRFVRPLDAFEAALLVCR